MSAAVIFPRETSSGSDGEIRLGGGNRSGGCAGAGQFVGGLPPASKSADRFRGPSGGRAAPGPGIPGTGPAGTGGDIGIVEGKGLSGGICLHPLPRVPAR